MTTAILRNWLDAGLGLIYPTVCQLCESGRALPKDGLVCAHCARKLRFVVPPFCERCGLPYEGDITTPFRCANCSDLELHFASARSAVIAAGVMLDVIHRYKYQQALWFEPFLADVFLRQAVPALRDEKWDFIVPVPLFHAKEREREFNQAERLAARLSAATKIPLNKNLLRRVQPTRTQTLLTRQQRAENVRSAFTFRSAEKLEGQRIVLVDDVFTTGATTNACAQALRAAGSGVVCVWTAARGL